MAKNEAGDDSGRPNLEKYEKELRRLQAELCKLQNWVKYKGLRVIIIFEGRDAAGKGGTIRAVTERVSPRVFRLVALPAPSDREKTQIYLQRYMQYFPAAGEVVIFDRSWYNRAGVEHVMGFCTPKQHKKFLELCPVSEKYMVDAGMIVIKYWMKVGQKEQQPGSKLALKTRSGSGSLVPWIWNLSGAGTNTPAHATACSKQRIPSTRHGTSFVPMTRKEHDSIASRIF
jgi:polyphosphate kinase